MGPEPLAARSPSLSARRVSISFGGVRALDDAGLIVNGGEVHGLLGENGSGKSTLIKVLAGYHVPEPGAVLEVHRRRCELPLAPAESVELGLGFVHQELGLIDALSVAENLFLAELAVARSLRLSRRGMRARARAILTRYRTPLEPTARVGELDPADRARLAIVRGAEQARVNRPPGRAGVLFLDEPTPLLPAAGRRWLFALLREAAAAGTSVVLVSHDIGEVLEFTDRVTVLRDGRTAGTLATSSATTAQLVGMIVGGPVTPAVSHAARPERRETPPASVANVRGEVVRGVSMELRAWEVTGLTGVGGSGFEELPYLLFGSRRAREGVLTLSETHDLTRMTPAAALRKGIAIVPGERLAQGAAGSLPVVDNVTLPVLARYRKGLRLERRRMVDDCAALMRRWGVRPPDPLLAFGVLSGGNQQKALLAKWLERDPSLLLLDEPTRGVDVGAREQIFEMIRGVAARGAIVLCASADHDQLCSVCDRVLVFARGAVAAELAGPDLTKERIAQLCYGDARDLH